MPIKPSIQNVSVGARATSFLQGLFLVVGSVLFAVLIAELFIRVIYKEEKPEAVQAYKTFIHETTEDLTLLYKPTPGAETVQNQVLNKINSAGFRDREFPVEKTAGVKRILFLGDSIVYGQDIPHEDTIPKQLEKKLNAAGHKAEVLNFGVVGYETRQELIRLKTLGLQYKPDVVILGYTLNDSRFASLEINKFNEENKWHVPSPRFKLHQRIPNFLYRNLKLLRYLDREKGLFDKKEKWRFYLRGENDIWHHVRNQNRAIEDKPDSPYRALRSEILAAAARLGTREADLKTMLDFIGMDNYVMYSSHWNVTKEALKELRDLSIQEGFELQVVIFPFLWNLKQYPLEPLHRFLKTEMSEMGISVIDSLEPMKEAWEKHGDPLTFDGIHYSRLGSEVFSDYFKAEIAEKYFKS